jgi:hypothetical protein
LGGLVLFAASLLAPLPVPSSDLILALLFSAECLALALSGASCATRLTFREALVLRNVAQILPPGLEPLITIIGWWWNLGLCGSIRFTGALTDAPSLLADPLVELLTPNSCDYLWRPFFAGGSSFDTRRDHAEHIAFNPVPYFAGSHHFTVDIPAPLEARPSNRLRSPP